MTRPEALELGRYLCDVADEIPNGLSLLSDAVTFAASDILIYARTGFQNSCFKKAVELAAGIPKVETIKDNDQLFEWMMKDTLHFKYWDMPIPKH